MVNLQPLETLKRGRELGLIPYLCPGFCRVGVKKALGYTSALRAAEGMVQRGNVDGLQLTGKADITLVLPSVYHKHMAQLWYNVMRGL